MFYKMLLLLCSLTSIGISLGAQEAVAVRNLRNALFTNSLNCNDKTFAINKAIKSVEDGLEGKNIDLLEQCIALVNLYCSVSNLVVSLEREIETGEAALKTLREIGEDSKMYSDSVQRKKADFYSKRDWQMARKEQFENVLVTIDTEIKKNYEAREAFVEEIDRKIKESA